MGVGLEIIRGSEPTVGLGVLLGSVATFIIVRVLVRVFPTEGTSVFSVGLLAIDLILSLALIVLTEGRDSAFLIYSLGPILLASLLMNLPSAMFAAIASSVAVTTGHVTPLLQMVKEALANVTKHAYATQVNAELDYDENGLKIRIQDDGRGFLLSGPTGHGMDIMKERTALASISVDVQSEPGDGTLVTVEYNNSKGRQRHYRFHSRCGSI